MSSDSRSSTCHSLLQASEVGSPKNVTVGGEGSQEEGKAECGWEQTCWSLQRKWELRKRDGLGFAVIKLSFLEGGDSGQGIRVERVYS